MNMDQMMMARMHEENYRYDMQLAQHFQEISNTYIEMANGEYQMYLHHSGQKQQMPGTMTQPMKPPMARTMTPPMTRAMTPPGTRPMTQPMKSGMTTSSKISGM